MSLPDKVRVACRIIGMRQADIMAYGFRGESVVIIEGPVGFKHIVPIDQLPVPAPKKKRARKKRAPKSKKEK